MIKPEQITDAMVDAVENKLGMGAGGWDFVDPHEVIAEAVNVVLWHLGIKADLGGRQMSNWRSLGKDIWHLEEREIRTTTDYQEMFEAGFYFADETQDFNGPFDTKEQAETALRQYAEHL